MSEPEALEYLRQSPCDVEPLGLGRYRFTDRRGGESSIVDADEFWSCAETVKATVEKAQAYVRSEMQKAALESTPERQ